jgi:hypothetical protein
MSRSLRVAPLPRRHARSLGYPTVGLALALAGCASQQPLTPHSWVRPADGQTSQPEGAMILATDPQPGHVSPPPGPQPQLPMEFIEDPAARRPTVACAGDCPATYRVAGPAADIKFRVEAGDLADARAVLSAVQPALHACAARRGVRPTWIQIRASVSPEGRMSPIEVRSDTNADSELVSCITNATLGSRFSRTWHASTILIVVEVSTA